MSIKSSDSSVEGVAGAAAAGLAIGGAMLVAAVIGGIARSLSKAGEKAYGQSVASLPARSKPSRHYAPLERAFPS
jgi:hypothetical protein